jgi:hypothetical protein
MNTPKNIPPLIDIPDADQFEEFLEWTPEEEEAFLLIVDRNEKEQE